jgi:hypothetical protein
MGPTSPEGNSPAMKNFRKGSYIAGTFASGGPEQTDADFRRFQLGLTAARILSSQHGWRTVWLIGETAKDVNFQDVAGTFTPQQINALRKGQPISLDSSTAVRFTTRRTMDGDRARHVILALHPTADLLKRLDQLHEEHAIIVIPWSGDHITEWAETWGAINLETMEPIERPIIDDPVVLEALNDFVNKSHQGDLKYSSDLAAVREMFKRLKKDGHRFKAKAIRSFVITESYRGVEVAEKIAKAAAPHAVKEERASAGNGP